ncbi:MAG: hypothetical protein FWC19_05645 [Treponema sp.]|nr:hypothetical protein [Treponema sp.]MCL2272271.1 hypothetical protein [Treponema sp.]
MIFIGVLIGVIIMSAMVYMALDKKSNFTVRIACLAAIAVMILTLLICLFLIFTDNKVVIDESVLIVGAPVETKKDDGNSIWIIIVLGVFLFALLALVAYQSLKEKRNTINDTAAILSDKSKDISSW